jgi:hypothetical protein
MPISFPTSGLTANVTTYSFGGLTWLWTGYVWQSVGSVSVQGLQGTQGIQGVQGTIGLTGSNGGSGPSGAQGLTGGFGIQGIQGTQGTQGIQGIQGFFGTSPIVYPATTASVGFTVQGLTGQTGRLTEWKIGATTLSAIDTAGNITKGDGDQIVLASQIF